MAASAPKLHDPDSAKTRSPRDTTINLRLPAQTRDLIDAAASALGKSRTEFVVDSARRQATDVLLDQRLFVLDHEKFDAFMRALENPPASGPKLKALMKRHPLWER